MPRKAAERSLALGEVDTFPFRLARDLGLTLGQVDQLPHSEHVRWRAFYVYEAAMIDFQRRVQAGRRG